MYKLRDYSKFATDFFMNHFLNTARLSVLMIYATTRCNSKCKTCNIWCKKPEVDLEFEVIKELLDARALSRLTRIGFEGGEFLLHPQAERILAYAATKRLRCELLSNGLLPQKLHKLVSRYPVQRVYLSLDGLQTTYQRVRGIDGFHKVLESIRLLRGVSPVSIMYLINPWNTPADLQEVMALCKQEQVDLRIGIYNNMGFFDTTQQMNETPLPLDWNLDFSGFPENEEFCRLYTSWQEGKVVLPCFSIRQALVVHPDGNIPLCQNKQLSLGNLHQTSLDAILASKATKDIQFRHRRCNGCWINFHRKFDLTLARATKFLPRRLQRSLLGEIELP